MSTLYRYEVGTNVHDDGVTAFLVKAEALTFEGLPMVRLPYGVISSAAGWHEDERMARLEAALEIENMASRLIGQAGRMRTEIGNLSAKGVE